MRKTRFTFFFFIIFGLGLISAPSVTAETKTLCRDESGPGECSYLMNDQQGWVQICTPITIKSDCSGKDCPLEKVEYLGTCLPDLDFATFEVVEYPFSKDKDHVYYYAKIIEGADVSSFKYLSKDYAKDKARVYAVLASGGLEELTGANVPTFHVFNDHVASDENYFYIDQEKITPTTELLRKYKVDPYQHWLENKTEPRTDMPSYWFKDPKLSKCLGDAAGRCVTGVGDGPFVPGENLNFADFWCVAIACNPEETCEGFKRGYWDCRLVRGKHANPLEAIALVTQQTSRARGRPEPLPVTLVRKPLPDAPPRDERIKFEQKFAKDFNASPHAITWDDKRLRIKRIHAQIKLTDEKITTCVQARSLVDKFLLKIEPLLGVKVHDLKYNGCSVSTDGSPHKVFFDQFCQGVRVESGRIVFNLTDQGFENMTNNAFVIEDKKFLRSLKEFVSPLAFFSRLRVEQNCRDALRKRSKSSGMQKISKIELVIFCPELGWGTSDYALRYKVLTEDFTYYFDARTGSMVIEFSNWRE